MTLFYKKCGYNLKLSTNTITFDRAGVLGQPFSLALKTCRHRTEQEKERMKNSSSILSWLIWYLLIKFFEYFLKYIIIIVYIQSKNIFNRSFGYL